MKMLHKYEMMTTKSLAAKKDERKALQAGEKGYYAITLKIANQAELKTSQGKPLSPQIGVPIDEFLEGIPDSTHKPYEEYENNFVRYVAMAYHVAIVSPRIHYEEVEPDPVRGSTSRRAVVVAQAPGDGLHPHFVYGDVVYFTMAGVEVSTIPMIFLCGLQVRQAGTGHMAREVEEMKESCTDPEFVNKCDYFSKTKAIVFMQTKPGVGRSAAEGAQFVVDPHHLADRPINGAGVQDEEDQLVALFTELRVPVPAACTANEFGTTSVNISFANLTSLTSYKKLAQLSDFPNEMIARAKMLLNHGGITHGDAKGGGEEQEQEEEDEDEEEGEDEEVVVTGEAKKKTGKKKETRVRTAGGPKQWSTNATKVVTNATKELKSAMANQTLTRSSLEAFEQAVFVRAEVWWAKIRAKNPTSTAGTGPKDKARAILAKAREVLAGTSSGTTTTTANHQPGGVAELRDLVQTLLSAQSQASSVAAAASAAAASSAAAQAPAPAQAAASETEKELLQLKLAAAKREGADAEAAKHTPKKAGEMAVTFESQLSLLQKLAKCEAKLELTKEADDRVDKRLEAERGTQASQSTMVLSALTSTCNQAMGMLAGGGMHPHGGMAAGGMHAYGGMAYGGMAYGGPPQLQGPQAGFPQLPWPQAGVPQLQGPQPQGAQAGQPPPQEAQGGGGTPAGTFPALTFHASPAPSPYDVGLGHVPGMQPPSLAGSPTPFHGGAPQHPPPLASMAPHPHGPNAFCAGCGQLRSASRFCPATGQAH